LGFYRKLPDWGPVPSEDFANLLPSRIKGMIPGRLSAPKMKEKEVRQDQGSHLRVNRFPYEHNQWLPVCQARAASRLSTIPRRTPFSLSGLMLLGNQGLFRKFRLFFLLQQGATNVFHGLGDIGVLGIKAYRARSLSSSLPGIHCRFCRKDIIANASKLTAFPGSILPEKGIFDLIKRKTGIVNH
jgi:hypothetical protein